MRGVVKRVRSARLNLGSCWASYRLSRGRANALRRTIHDQCTVAHTDNRTSQSPRADTFLGPAFLGFGYGGAGNWSLYLLLGAP